MSESNTPDRAADSAAGRHRGPASAEEADKSQPPHGKHRRPSDD
ncbi:hypothetical protein ACFO3J_27540 [Streptomyces polygonati]|uniref:Uncharacterized protein n=1 Tax=Streptomyces polygonati TaxID=1617087 RepID=A0ABV8HTB8_9ACTN